MLKSESPFQDPGSSFYDWLSVHHPDALLGFRPRAGAEGGGPSPAARISHGTTVLALKYKDGVIIAGDRMATEGYQVSARRIEKVYKMDEHSAIAIAGAAGPCIELAKLFQTELEHYEKLEGAELSIDGKANKLAQMVKGNLPMAFQGLIVVPIFVGYDPKRSEGRIFKYDITGGRYEETDYFSTGSGGKDARTTMKKLYQPGMEEPEAVRTVLEALYDASEEDIGTGGPDLIRGIYPTVKTITVKGVSDVPESQIHQIYERLIEKRKRET
ncbi:MAG: proteasome subunit beta [Nitrospirae bacterium]|nr:proteasome subunit beta [Nitrospirota bacterium]